MRAAVVFSKRKEREMWGIRKEERPRSSIYPFCSGSDKTAKSLIDEGKIEDLMLDALNLKPPGGLGSYRENFGYWLPLLILN